MRCIFNTFTRSNQHCSGCASAPAANTRTNGISGTLFETGGAGAASSKHGMPAAPTKWRGSCGGPRRCKRSFPEEGFPAAYHPRCNRKPLTSLSQASTRQRPNAMPCPDDALPTTMAHWGQSLLHTLCQSAPFQINQDLGECRIRTCCCQAATPSTVLGIPGNAKKLAHGSGASGIARVCYKVGRARRGGAQGKNSDRRYWRETRWSTLNGANVRNNIK